MSGLLSFLLRSGGGILRESAEMFIGRALMRNAVRRLVGLVALYAALAVFALAALAFFYVLLYRWLSVRLGEESAAAILSGANLLVIALILIGRALFRQRTPKGLTSPLGDLTKSHVSGLGTGGLGTGNADLEAGIAIGSQIGRQIRKAAPEIALVAALAGLIIGVRPQILGMFRRRGPKEPRD
jgi:hypothetical protein